MEVTWMRYREVLGVVRPKDLARLVWRRAYRNARESLGRNVIPETEAELVRALQAHDAADAAERLLAGPVQGWWRELHRARVVAGLTPEARARMVSRAERALTASLAWHADSVSGHVWERVAAAEVPLRVPGSDPKSPWTLGRLDEVLALALATWAAPNSPRYVRGFIARVTDFLNANPVGVGIQWTCPMEVALRAANLAQALTVLAVDPAARALLHENGFSLRLLAALVDHARWVDVHLEDAWSVPNNHLVSNWVGLAVVGALFPSLPGMAALAERAVRGLETEMALQVHPDGYAFEGSVPYHRLSVELFTLGFLAARALCLPLETAYAERLERMFEVVRAYGSDAGQAPQLGDNDSGRALILGEYPSLEHGYLLPLGAALFRSPALKAPGAQPSDELLWLLGDAGLETFAALAGRAPPLRFTSTPGGLHVLRIPGAVVSVSAGPVGQRGIGGHSHNDRLSFELHLADAALVVDAGTGTYTRDAALRNTLRATAAHNTLELDAAEQSPFNPAQLFALPDRAGCTVESHVTTPSVQKLVAFHRGYARLPNPATVRRSFVLDALERALCISDTVESEGMHHAVERLHFGPDVTLKPRGLAAAELRRARAIPGAPVRLAAKAFALHVRGTERAVVVFPEGTSVCAGEAPYSPGYGELTVAPLLEARATTSGTTTLALVILFTDAASEVDA